VRWSGSARASTASAARSTRSTGSCASPALRALEDAELTFKDIDAIVIGKAPDALEGVIMPELSLADALGAVGKPIHRVHTAGSVGASTAISACTLVESGMYERVLTVCYEKQSDGNATWALGGGAAAARARADRSRRGSASTSRAARRPSTSAGRWR
jgi:acetyl-CoA C-acetyltransferase